METEFIIIILFNSKLEGITYLDNSEHKFVFTDGDEYYDKDGDIVDVDFEHETYTLDQISLQIGEKSLPGGLYLDNGFIKYFKEI